MTWTPDGSSLVFERVSVETGKDILLLELDGDATPLPLLSSEFNEHAPKLSPNGEWLAYISDETGQFEVYLQKFPEPSRKETVSIGGGSEPVWSADGRELYYRNGNRLFMVAIDTTGGLRIERPVLLFDRPFDPNPGSHAHYDAAPDGRFVMVVPLQESAPTKIRVITDWAIELQS